MKAAGLPHSEIPGSKPVDGSPELIAVFRVLHSLLMPRHPSCARIRLARLGIGVRFLRSLRSDRTVRTRSLRKLKASTYLFCLNEKFLALWRGSLPADLVYELQFSFNFQLPVVKDRLTLERGRSRKQQTLVHLPSEALMGDGGFHHLSPKGDVSLERR